MPHSKLIFLFSTLMLFLLAGCAKLSIWQPTISVSTQVVQNPTIISTLTPFQPVLTEEATSTQRQTKVKTKTQSQTLTILQNKTHTPYFTQTQTQTLPSISIQTQPPNEYTPELPLGEYLPVKLAWFYKPPETSLDELVTDYDFFILTHNDEKERDYLKSSGVDDPILQYLLMNEIMNPGSCDTEPYNDQVAFKPGDYCWIQSNHPDWFLTAQDGHVIGPGQYHMMDSGNSGWLTFWLERASFLQENYGWDGIFLDNVEASLSKMEEWGDQPAKYPDDASYQIAIENELKFLYTQYFHPNGRQVYANIISVRDPQVWLRYLQYLDGVMIEDFAIGWPNSNGLTTGEWERQMDIIGEAQKMGKTVILVAQGNQYDKERQKFALASYWLVNDGLAYFRYTNHNTYEEAWSYPNQDQELGVPLGNRYQDGNIWRRDFSNGSVMVDPSSRTASITIY